MANCFEGSATPPPGRFAVVASRFNVEVVQLLVDGAIDGFKSHGVADNSIDLVWVPGAFEIPLTALRLAETERYIAIVCLGAVIRGETDHYDFVARAATDGILQAGMRSGLPVIFGVLTCDNETQALDRAGGKEGNKGFDAATTAMVMANLLRRISEPRAP
jgi:6,7-dimethyl-8-ribityllumazine synthase